MQEQEKQTAKGRDLYEWVQSLVGSVLVVVAIFTFVIRMMGVDGHSMLNTLQHGDRLLVVNSMLYHDYKYGDIVILRKNGVFDDDPIVKRVIAVEGQTVDIDFAEGIVYVDGEALEEDYLKSNQSGLHPGADLHRRGHRISPDGAGGVHFRHGRQPQRLQRQPGLPAGYGGYPVCHREGCLFDFPRSGL